MTLSIYAIRIDAARLVPEAVPQADRAEEIIREAVAAINAMDAVSSTLAMLDADPSEPGGPSQIPLRRPEGTS